MPRALCQSRLSLNRSKRGGRPSRLHRLHAHRVRSRHACLSQRPVHGSKCECVLDDLRLPCPDADDYFELHPTPSHDDFADREDLDVIGVRRGRRGQGLDELAFPLLQYV